MYQLTDSHARYGFIDDYSESAHPSILNAIARSTEQYVAYGGDDYNNLARSLLCQAVGDDDAAVFFVPTGTSANLLCILSCLKPHEAVIATTQGHIVDMEAGAIEASGHKIYQAQGVNGKITSEIVRTVCLQNQLYPHKAQPRMVYISNATEVGTVYTQQELTDLKAVCRELGLLLFMDGARLGVALSSSKNDMDLKNVYDITDIFWIGGTKLGALFGEAVIIKNKSIAADFPFHLKQRGLLLAKNWVIAIQFIELFRNNLIYALGRHANLMASKIAVTFVKSGFTLLEDSDANQVFAKLPVDLVQALQGRFRFYIMRELEKGHMLVRIVTSWATQEIEVDKFNALVTALCASDTIHIQDNPERT